MKPENGLATTYVTDTAKILVVSLYALYYTR